MRASTFDLDSYRQLQAAVTQGTAAEFEALALTVFNWQRQHNAFYARFLDLLDRNKAVERLDQIPFLPIQFFKSHAIQSGQWEAALTFSSSGTTGQRTSRHYLRSADWYTNNCIRGFQQHYGDPADFCWLALLPNYLERQGSSLVFMAEQFIQRSRFAQSGFFLYDYEALNQRLQACRQAGIPTVLLGVSFALLDLAERYPQDLNGVIIMETGGMKGRRKELTRAELHAELGEAFQVPTIHSEYGMTELLSQAYSQGKEQFTPAPTMKVLARDLTDPLHHLPPNRSGPLDIIDLANLDSCAFIATDDLGRVAPDGSFSVLGRIDHSDIRGCNLLFDR